MTQPTEFAQKAPAFPIVEKTNSIQQVRYVCSIAAMHSASAIPGVIPITHCGPGCLFSKGFLLIDKEPEKPYWVPTAFRELLFGSF